MSDLDKNRKAKGYILNIDLYIKAVELAQLKGKKPGDSIEEEISEIIRANPDKTSVIE